MLSKVASLRQGLQTGAKASDNNDSIDGGAASHDTLSTILSSGMDWDLKCYNIEERSRCAHMPQCCYSQWPACKL